MGGISKYQIYQIAKFFVLSFIIIYFLYFQWQMPLNLVMILEILLLIKILPITKYVEGKIVRYYPRYENFNIWIKRLILLVVYIVVYALLKFVVVNIIMIGILNIPIEEQIYDFIARYNK